MSFPHTACDADSGDLAVSAGFAPLAVDPAGLTLLRELEQRLNAPKQKDDEFSEPETTAQEDAPNRAQERDALTSWAVAQAAPTGRRSVRVHAS